MSKAIYTTEIFGDTITMRGNFTEASCPVEFGDEDGDWSNDECGRQVADFQHSPEVAMRDYLERLVRAGGDDPADFADAINDAIDEME